MFALKFFSASFSLGGLELIRDVLVNSGVPREQVVEETGKKQRCIVVYFKQRVAAQKLKDKVASFKLRGVRSAIAVLNDTDWKTRWKKYFKPFKITPGIRIVPYVPGKRLAARISADTVYIDTTAAFGTGLHATTRMMAGFIAGAQGRFRSFLDLGTGSGILAVIACRYGAKDIWAIDIDKAAVKTARRNLLVNRCPANHLKHCPVERFVPSRRFDFVAANLLTEDLVRLESSLTRLVWPGGFLAVSGIYADNYPLFAKRFRPRGFRCAKVSCSKKWYALLFQRSA